MGARFTCSAYVTLNLSSFSCLHPHGTARLQNARFKSTDGTVLVATDIAARGLDVKNIQNVINFEASKSIDTHVHRIGRTGRMGVDGVSPGSAYTLLTSKDSNFSIDLLKNMKLSGKSVMPDLQKLAESDKDWHRRRHELQGGGGGGGRQGHGSLGLGNESWITCAGVLLCDEQFTNPVAQDMGKRQ